MLVLRTTSYLIPTSFPSEPIITEVASVPTLVHKAPASFSKVISVSLVGVMKAETQFYNNIVPFSETCINMIIQTANTLYTVSLHSFYIHVWTICIILTFTIFVNFLFCDDAHRLHVPTYIRGAFDAACFSCFHRILHFYEDFIVKLHSFCNLLYFIL